MPISDDLSLDISSALASVDQIGTALADLSATPLTPTVDAAAVTDELTSAIDAAATEPVVIEADTAAFEGGIEGALAAANLVVPVDADTTSLVDEIDSAAAGQTVTIEVEADTTQAQTDIAALGETSTAAIGSEGGGGGGGSGVAGLTGAIGGMTTAATGGGEGVGALAGGISSAAGVTGVAAAGVAALGVVTDKYFDQAVNATAAQQRFNQQFGEAADATQQIDFGGVTTSLGDLDLQLGSSTTQVKNALSNFAVLGHNVGASNQQIGEAANNIAILSANAAASNPALGSVGDVAERLDRLLARGGPRLGQYGINLNSVDINARAADIALQRGSTTVTDFDKRVAGAQLAMEQLGPSFKKNIDDASQNPIIQLRQISAEFAKFTTQLGKPLIAPVFDIIRTAEPVLEAIARLFGEVIQAVLPLAQAFEHAFEPLIGGAITTAGTIIAEFVPVIQQLAAQIEAVLRPAFENLQPLFDSLVQAFGEVARQMGVLFDETGPLSELLGSLGNVELIALVKVLTTVIDLFTRFGSVVGALSSVLGPLGQVLEVFGLFSGGQDQATEASKKFADSQQVTIKSLADLQGSLDKTNTDFASFITTQSEFAKAGLVDELRRTGISMGDLQKDLNNLDSGFKDFVARAIDAGQVKITLDGADVTGSQIRELDGSLTDYLNTSGAVVVQGGELVSTFGTQTLATEKQAEANFRALAAQQGLTDEQQKSIAATAAATLGADSYSNRLIVLAQQQKASADAEAEKNAELAKTPEHQAAVTAGLAALAQQALTTGVTEQDLKAKSDELGLSHDQLKQFTDGVRKAYEDFQKSLTGAVPGIDTALKSIGDATAQGSNPQKVIDNLNISTQAFVSYRDNLTFLASSGFTDLARLAAQKGPEFTNALVDSLRKGRPGLGAELNNNVAVFNQQSQQTLDFLTNDFAPKVVDTTSLVGQQVTATWGQNLGIPGVTSEQMAGVPGAITASSAPAEAAAAATGTSTAASFSGGFQVTGGIEQQFAQAEQLMRQTGLSGSLVNIAAGNAGGNIGVAFVKGMAITISAGAEGNAPVAVAMRKLVDDAEAVARAQAGAHSPSTVFAAIGQDLGLGLAQGITQSTQLAVSAIDEQMGVLARFTQTRIDGVVEEVTSFVDGSFIVATTEGVDRAASQLGGQATTALNSGLIDVSNTIRNAQLAQEGYAGALTTSADQTARLASSTASLQSSLKGVQAAGVTPNAFFGQGGAQFGQAAAAPVSVQINVDATGATAEDANAIAGAITTQTVPSLERVFATVARS